MKKNIVFAAFVLAALLFASEASAQTNAVLNYPVKKTSTKTSVRTVTTKNASVSDSTKKASKAVDESKEATKNRKDSAELQIKEGLKTISSGAEKFFQREGEAIEKVARKVGDGAKKLFKKMGLSGKKEKKEDKKAEEK